MDGMTASNEKLNVEWTSKTDGDIFGTMKIHVIDTDETHTFRGVVFPANPDALLKRAEFYQVQFIAHMQ